MTESKEKDYEDFAKLIAEVKEIDDEAGTWIKNSASFLDSFVASGCLGEVFMWHETPQGYKFWHNIADRLPNEYY